MTTEEIKMRLAAIRGGGREVSEELTEIVSEIVDSIPSVKEPLEIEGVRFDITESPERAIVSQESLARIKAAIDDKRQVILFGNIWDGTTNYGDLQVSSFFKNFGSYFFLGCGSNPNSVRVYRLTKE